MATVVIGGQMLSLLLTLVVMSVIIFSLLGPLPLAWRLASRVLLIPVLAGLAYAAFGGLRAIAIAPVRICAWVASGLSTSRTRWRVTGAGGPSRRGTAGATRT